MRVSRGVACSFSKRASYGLRGTERLLKLHATREDLIPLDAKWSTLQGARERPWAGQPTLLFGVGRVKEGGRLALVRRIGTAAEGNASLSPSAGSGGGNKLRHRSSSAGDRLFTLIERLWSGLLRIRSCRRRLLGTARRRNPLMDRYSRFVITYFFSWRAANVRRMGSEALNVC